MSKGLKQLRNMMRMTQEELAEKMNVSRQTVAKWENGESVPDVVKCSELSKIFNLSLDDMASFFIKKGDDNRRSPKNKFFFGTCVIHSNKIELPESALKQFDLNNGDELLLIGDTSQGLALVSKTGFAAVASQVLNSSVFGSDFTILNNSKSSDNKSDSKKPVHPGGQ